MPSGAAVIKYEGKRGVVWRIKYRDAEGVQVMETLGRTTDGSTEKKAKAELRKRLVRVERRQYRRPKPITFRAYADTWYEEGQRRRDWKPLTKGKRRVPRCSGIGSETSLWTPTENERGPGPGESKARSEKPASLNHVRTNGARSEPARCRVQMISAPRAQSCGRRPIVRRISP